MRLVERSDVFVENLKPSTLHRLGIHETVLLDRNPRLMRSPPPAGRPERRLGRLHGLRGPVRRSERIRLSVPATLAPSWSRRRPPVHGPATGPAGAFAVLAALHYREATGRGQLIELAQLENVINHLGDVSWTASEASNLAASATATRASPPRGSIRAVDRAAGSGLRSPMTTSGWLWHR